MYTKNISTYTSLFIPFASVKAIKYVIVNCTYVFVLKASNISPINILLQMI